MRDRKSFWRCFQNVCRIQALLTTPIVIISPLNCLLTGPSSSILSCFGLHMEASIKTHIRSWHFSTQNHFSSPRFTGCSLLLCPHLHYSLPHSIPPYVPGTFQAHTCHRAFAYVVAQSSVSLAHSFLRFAFKHHLLRVFPGGPVAKILHSQCKGPDFDPWSRN